MSAGSAALTLTSLSVLLLIILVAYVITVAIQKGLATEFDITDQAVTERLRRAIRHLVSSTLLLTEQGE